MVSTTAENHWRKQEVKMVYGKKAIPDAVILPDNTQQTIDGFGACFNEQGWTSLNTLSTKDREAVMKELFAPDVGASFTIFRMPIGANDFSLNWYSYNETDGDFDMNYFSIENDTKTLIPFIKNAQKYNPNLKIWASPWSPPQWMKKNKHYAQLSTQRGYEMYAFQNPGQQLKQGETGSLVFGDMEVLVGSQFDNGLAIGKGEGKEGSDMFIQDPKYLKAYALYFSKFIDAYQAHDINIFAVMPQNEFNSAQIFPSCCWTARGLSNFIGEYLGPAMEKLGVDIYFGTIERPNEALIDSVIQNEKSGKYIKGVGFQWEGKDALPGINQRYSDLKMVQTEQECGNGKNDWKGAMHSWDLMKYYLNNGVSIYEYWNTSLFKGGVSRWGWLQNSLIVVDSKTKTYRFTPEYYLMKHVSHFVKPGAQKIEVNGKNKEVLAFQNPDKSIIVVLANTTSTPDTFHIQLGENIYAPVLEANSFNTMIIK
ncbi:MAG: beta-glycosidase [Bacteroidales bacterium]|nr:MAG: beta-glycosidase [Bacteroidales bacterium]